MIWSSETEQKIQDFLVAQNPDFKEVINKGFHWIQQPSRLSRFYMRDAAAWLREHRGTNIKVLDFGAGTCTSTLYYYSQGFTKIEAMDSDLYLVEVANRLFKLFGAPIRAMGVKYEDVYQLRGSWDAVLMQDFLYFKFDLEKVLQSLRNVLPRGGVLIFDLLDFETPPKHGNRVYMNPSQVSQILKEEGYALRGMSILDQGDSRKTSYYTEYLGSESILAPGGKPWV
ncbi:MAG: class I SAM-dependent methyltransferase [Actinobacteria bacterium]|nr:class I SAM-dependent methyltransferase [Actinomycetota bacterium]